MLVYLYTADYNDENVLNTKETPVNGAQNGETSGTVAESSNKDNTDDAPAQASSLFTKPVAPAGAQDVQNYSMHRERASVSACLNNVLLYSLGEKYDDMKSLKELAKCKLEIRSSGNWREDDILHVLQEIYSTTPAADRGLRDIIINVCARYADDLMLHEGFRQLLQQDAALAMEILDRVHSTKLQLGQRAHDLEQHKTRLQTQEATLKDELEWTKEEKRLLHENLAQHGKCRHCSKGLDLSVVRGSRVGFVSTKSREVQMRCSRCSTKYSSF